MNTYIFVKPKWKLFSMSVNYNIWTLSQVTIFMLTAIKKKDKHNNNTKKLIDFNI